MDVLPSTLPSVLEPPLLSRTSGCGSCGSGQGKGPCQQLHSGDLDASLASALNTSSRCAPQLQHFSSVFENKARASQSANESFVSTRPHLTLTALNRGICGASGARGLQQQTFEDHDNESYSRSRLSFSRAWGLGHFQPKTTRPLARRQHQTWGCWGHFRHRSPYSEVLGMLTERLSPRHGFGVLVRNSRTSAYMWYATGTGGAWRS